MAEDQDERTEQASQRRLEKAREDGDVAVGKDTAMVAGLAGTTIALIVSGPAIRDSLVLLTQASVRQLASTSPGITGMGPFVARPAMLAAGAIVAGTLAGIFVLGVQTKGGFWPQLAMPNPARLFSGGRLKQIIGKEMLGNLLLAFVKTITIGYVLYRVYRDEFVTLPRLLEADAGVQLASLFAPLASGLVKILTALTFIAGLDFAVTRWRYKKKMMMTKEEAKREYKEEEGDPLFRARRKRRHRDLLKGQIRAEVPKADVLLVNPTHIAIALRYRPGEDKAPKVTAKGKGVMAEMMRDLARQHAIPIVEDIPLARMLYRRVKVGRSVPIDTYKAVAAILAFVYRVLGRVPGNPAAAGAAR